jgi:hypothetical protein
MSISSLKILAKNNPTIELKESSNYTVVQKTWNDSSFCLIVPKKTRIPSLSNVYLFEEFNSIYHSKKNLWEFIFRPEKKDNLLINRNFKFNYKGKVFDCYFERASSVLKFFAENIRILSTETPTTYRNLREFKDFFSKNKPEYLKEYFKERLPISFYIKGDIDDIINKVEFAKNLNFYLTYFDRESPTIQIFPIEKIELKFKKPCYTLFDDFPKEINSSSIDLTLLDILDVANKTSDIRLEFIFYFQILEYCSYYYLEQQDDLKLRQILKKPDINYNADDYIKEIIEVLSERFNVNKNSDKTRLEKTIKNFCQINDIELELKENEASFKEDILFDGGLKIKSLFKDVSALESNSNGIINEVINNITKIRNVIVHLRESRENTVILPTDKNNIYLLPYLFLLRRIAEKVAIQFE